MHESFVRSDLRDTDGAVDRATDGAMGRAAGVDTIVLGTWFADCFFVLLQAASDKTVKTMIHFTLFIE
jgi:hypothetical protein